MTPTRTLRRRGPVALIAGLLAVALVAAACTDDGEDASSDGASGSTQSVATWDPETVPLLDPVAGGSGPVAPVFRGAVVDASLGTATSTSPILRWTDAPGPGPYRFVVTDLGPDGGRELWSSGSEPTPQVTVPDGVLENGRAYRWSVSDGAGGALGPLVVRVDVQRPGVQLVDQVGDVSVARSSGEAVVSWTSPTLATVEGDVGLGLTFRASSGQATTGLPAGWTLTVEGSGTWRQLEEHDDGTVTLVDDRGVPVIFEPNPGDDAGYRAVWGESQQWPTGSFSTLVRNDDGTWTIQDTGGTVTTFAAAVDGVAHVASVWNAARAVPEQRFTDGRLVSLTDPVSQRSIELAYGGEDACGDEAVPDGLLCGALLWDGTRLAVAYRTGADPSAARLARLVSWAGTGATASVVDLAYDDVGRIAAVRSPLATASVAAGTRSAGPGVTTQIAYDDQGRTTSVTLPEPTPGAARAQRTYRYAVEADRVTTTVEVPGQPSPLSVVTADASTFQLLESIDQAGRRSTATWDRSNDRVEQVTYPGDLVTQYVRDDLGVTTRRVGPATPLAILGGGAPTTEVGTDLRFDGGADLDGRPMRGLAATYWDGPTWSGTPVRSEVGPAFGEAEVPDPYRFSWSEPPVDGADWSARLAGVLRLPAAGEWTISTGGAALWVDERPCRPSCVIPTAGARPVRIRIDVTGPSGDVDLQWSGPGVSGNVPADALAPAFGRTSRQSQSDALGVGSPVEMVGRMEYSDPAAGLVSASWTASGLQRRTEAEPYRPGEGEYSRILTQTPPEGPARRIEYHPTTEPVADPCGSGDHVQGGLVSTNVSPGGSSGSEVRTAVVFDDAGRDLANRPSEAEEWTCTTRDAAGRPVLTEYRGASGDQERTVAIAYEGPSSAGPTDPTVTTTTSTTAAGASLTETIQTDLLGRMVSSRDLWGTVTEVTYDPQFPDRIVRNVVRPAGGASSTIEFTHGPSGERLTSTLDGRLFATYTYDDAGRPLAITSGPVVTSFEYDATGRPSTRTVRSPSGEWREQQVTSPTGRSLAMVLSGPEGRAEYRYRYDVDARLVGATLESTVPVTETAWTFGYDPDGNLTSRTAARSDGTTQTVRNTYDEGARLSATDDPALAGGGGTVAFDATGRVESLGPLAFTYDASGSTREVRAQDGSSVAFTTRFGRTVARTTTRDGTTTSLRYGDGGVLYDGTGRFLGRELTGAGAGKLFVGANGSVQRVVATGSGNRWFVLDANGAPVGGVALYEPYGRRIDVAGQTPPPVAPEAPLQPGFQLVDGVRVGGVELTPLGARTYLPTLGAFVQPDPLIGAGTNPYSYADADPVNGHDPTGGFTEWLSSVGSWFSDNGEAILSWSLLAVTAVAAAGLAYVAGPAVGKLVSQTVTASLTLGTRLVIVSSVSAVVGWGVGVGATYVAGAVMGWDISFSTAASVGAGFAAIALVRPLAYWRQLIGEAKGVQGLFHQNTSMPGYGFTKASVVTAWNDVRRVFGLPNLPVPRTQQLSRSGSFAADNVDDAGWWPQRQSFDSGDGSVGDV